MPPRLVIVRLVHDQCTISLDIFRWLLAPTRLPPGNCKSSLARDSGRRSVAGCWLGPFCSVARSLLHPAHPDRSRTASSTSLLAKTAVLPSWIGRAFDYALWRTCYTEALAVGSLPPRVEILASDRDAGAIHIAQSNAERANVLADIQFSCRAFSTIEPPAGTARYVTNPPYGVRVSPSHDLPAIFIPTWEMSCARFVPTGKPVSCAPVTTWQDTRVCNLIEPAPLINGGIPVKFFMGKV